MIEGILNDDPELFVKPTLEVNVKLVLEISDYFETKQTKY